MTNSTASTNTPLAEDLAKLPLSLRLKLLAVHEEASQFASTANKADFDAFRGAYGLLKLLTPVAGLSDNEAARISNSSPATFTRWKNAADIATPHPAHVSGVFDGLRAVADLGARRIEQASTKPLVP